MQRNGCPKGCFWRVRFFSAPSRFALKASENLKGAEKNDSPKTLFWTTISPHDAFSAPWRTPIEQLHCSRLRVVGKMTFPSSSSVPPQDHLGTSQNEWMSCAVVLPSLSCQAPTVWPCTTGEHLALPSDGDCQWLCIFA